MSDRPDHDSSGPSAPPPAPWWSSPSGSWGAPTPDPSARPYSAPEQPTVVQEHPGAHAPQQPPYGEAAYGEPGYGRPEVLQQDGRSTPWAFPPGSYREPLPAHDTVGRAPEPSGRRRGLSIAGAVLATALVAGGAGGIVGARTSGSDGLLDPSASLGGSSSAAPAVEREPGSVAAIAAEVLKSTVSIGVASGSGSGTGSGVVIRSDGYVLTNNHVVESAAGGAGQITVTVNSTGVERPAQIVGLDPDTDLAVLKVDGAGQLVPARLGQSRDLVVGDPVIAIGSPLGLEGSVTTGIVSALNRNPAVPSETGGQTFLANAIQTDAAINPGNSGGALVNSKGEVVGINSAIATSGGSGSIGIGFSIPIDEARSIAEEIIRTGKVTHPAIGVTAQTEARKGARVVDVAPGSTAERAGLQNGDLITKIEDDEVTSVDELILAIRSHQVGDEITITYTRDGSSRTARATLQDKRTR